MPDELFEALWGTQGGPELVALHSLFAGTSVPAAQVRDHLRLGPEGVRRLLEMAKAFGLVDPGESEISFIAYPADSGQRARLDWCLEPHGKEMDDLVARTRSRLLVRFLKGSPGKLS